MFSCRFLESHWFVWVTQMNHIVMEIDQEAYRDWFSSQVGKAGPVTRAVQSLVPVSMSWPQMLCICRSRAVLGLPGLPVSFC